MHRMVRVSTVIQKRVNRSCKVNRPTRVNRVIPYVIDYVNTDDTFVHYIKTLTETFIETEMMIVLSYIILASRSLKYYKQPKSLDD